MIMIPQLVTVDIIMMLETDYGFQMSQDAEPG